MTTLREALIYDLGLHIVAGLGSQIMHAANWLRHQAMEMDAHATAILKQYHQLPHTPK